jgi:hypothetical protein
MIRLLGVTGIAFLLACGEAGSVDETGHDTAALSDEYVGDRGGETTLDAEEVDPTRAQSFSRAAVAAKIAEAPAKAVLDFTWFGQETGYWCGPGSTRMAISTHMTTPPSQTELADFMGTTKEGTVRADEVRALNNYLAPSVAYVSVPMDSVPTQDQRDLLKATVVSRISNGWPVVANVLSGWRPPGYPSGTIGHFVAVVGYDQHGDQVMIADPAGAGSPGPRWNDVPKTYWISMQNLGTWIGGRGYSGDAPAPAP